MRIFKSNLDKLETAKSMFYVAYFDTCEDVESFRLSFTSNLPKLKIGSEMFNYVGSFIHFQKNENGDSVELPNLEKADYMFCETNGLKFFNKIDMPKLKDANHMFSTPFSGTDYELESWNGNLDSLENGFSMFCGCYDGWGSGDNSIPYRFNSDLPKLKYGQHMYPAVYEFRGSLPSLVNGYMMFGDSEMSLDSLAIKHIVESIPDRTGLQNKDEEGYVWDEFEDSYGLDPSYGGYIDISCGCENTDSDKQLYAEEGGFSSFQDILNQFSAKNWVVRFAFNGRPSQSYSLRREIAPENPIWIKLDEVDINEEVQLKNGKKKKPYFNYKSEDETKCYILKSFHESNETPEGYRQFNSLEEAEHYFNIKPVERNY